MKKHFYGILFFCLCISFSTNAHADFSHTYQGKLYGSVSETNGRYYDTTMSISGFFETLNAFEENQVYNLTNDVTSWGFNDGLFNYNESNGGYIRRLKIWTDDYANIDRWEITVRQRTAWMRTSELITQNFAISGPGDSVGILYGEGVFMAGAPGPGTWTSNISPVPIPSAIYLFISGAIGYAGYRRKMKA